MFLARSYTMWCQVTYSHFTHSLYSYAVYWYTIVAVKLKQTYLLSATLTLWLLWCTVLFWPAILHLILFCVHMYIWMLHFVSVSVYWFKCWSILTMMHDSIETHNNVNTFALRGVLVLRGLSRQQSGRSTSTLRFSKTCLKKSIGAIGFRFVPLDSPMFVVSVTVFSFLQVLLVHRLGSCGRTIAQQTVLTLHSMHAVVLSQLTQPADALNYYTPLLSMHD